MTSSGQGACERGGAGVNVEGGKVWLRVTDGGTGSAQCVLHPADAEALARMLRGAALNARAGVDDDGEDVV